MRLKAINKYFPGAASNDFICYIKPTLKNPENQQPFLKQPFYTWALTTS